MRISDWSSDVCSSDLIDSLVERVHALDVEADTEPVRGSGILDIGGGADEAIFVAMAGNPPAKRREHVEMIDRALFAKADIERDDIDTRSEEHTSELQ